jgi:signal transduction histidine kinase/ActR/RegA family two-component response regulator
LPVQVAGAMAHPFHLQMSQPGEAPGLSEQDALRETFDLLAQGLFLFSQEDGLLLENTAGKRLRREGKEHPIHFEGQPGDSVGSLDEVLARLARRAWHTGQVATAAVVRGGQHFEVGAQPTSHGRALIYVHDVTTDRDDEVRRLQAEKLASIGMLAAGVAHEINNPASFVLANVEALSGLLRLLDEKLRADPAAARRLGLRDLLFEATAIVQESKEGMARIHRIVRDLHAFSRVEQDPRGVTDVNTAIDSALSMVRNELRYRAEVERDLRATRAVRGNSARIGQVFLNLIINATHALPEGEQQRNRIWLRSFDEGDVVVVEVQDNGVGIEPEVMPRIFDSFFTTKPAGVGTGLGLSISREIIRASGGEIMAESRPGQGALFRVRLPAASEEPLAQENTPTPLPHRRRYRLLAIDDETLLLKAYRRMLIDHHDVQLAGGGREALAVLEHDQQFDVILCDLQMPELSGADVYRTVARRWPGLEKKIIVITGGAFSPEARRFLDESAVTSLNKPFHLDEILDIIDRRAAATRR